MKNTYCINIEALTKPSKFKKGIWEYQYLCGNALDCLRKRRLTDE